MDIRKVKRDFRVRMKEVRRKAQLASPAAALALRDLFMSEVDLPPDAILAGYAPLAEEMDVFPLLSALTEKGCPLCLPVVRGKGQELVFRAFKSGDPMVEGALGVREPLLSAEEKRPTVVLIPLLAFDSSGHRLGYGGGFYDRTLLALREKGPVLALGIGFAAQQVEKVPIGYYDRPMDGVITENKYFKFN